jgi:hypothetical protein
MLIGCGQFHPNKKSPCMATLFYPFPVSGVRFIGCAAAAASLRVHFLVRQLFFLSPFQTPLGKRGISQQCLAMKFNCCRNRSSGCRKKLNVCHLSGPQTDKTSVAPFVNLVCLKN